MASLVGRGVPIVNLSNRTFKAGDLGAALERREGDVEVDLRKSEARWGDCAKIASQLNTHADHCNST